MNHELQNAFTRCFLGGFTITGFGLRIAALSGLPSFSCCGVFQDGSSRAGEDCAKLRSFTAEPADSVDGTEAVGLDDVQPQLSLIGFLDTYRQARSELARRAASACSPIVGRRSGCRSQQLRFDDAADLGLRERNAQRHHVHRKLPAPSPKVITNHSDAQGNKPASCLAVMQRGNAVVKLSWIVLEG
jgi:hypothetical protein